MKILIAEGVEAWRQTFFNELQDTHEVFLAWEYHHFFELLEVTKDFDVVVIDRIHGSSVSTLIFELKEKVQPADIPIIVFSLDESVIGEVEALGAFFVRKNTGIRGLSSILKQRFGLTLY